MPAELNFVPIGVDEYGEMVPLYLAHSTGVGIYGAPRWGKTSLILGLLTAMAEHEEFQIVLADGKVTTGFEGDYAEHRPSVASRSSGIPLEQVQPADQGAARAPDLPTDPNPR
uniref:hypothetical protein n=1 Tax=Nocardia sp. 107 TaxID=373212 RepID=UPI0018689219|nr:hypothetical protein [Nocardia sp. 107]